MGRVYGHDRRASAHALGGVKVFCPVKLRFAADNYRAPAELKVTVDAFSKQKRSELKYHKGELWMTFE